MKYLLLLLLLPYQSLTADTEYNFNVDRVIDHDRLNTVVVTSDIQFESENPSKAVYYHIIPELYHKNLIDVRAESSKQPLKIRKVHSASNELQK